MSRTTRTKGLAVIGTAAALLTPVAFAVPAQAATTKDGCTVTAGTPYYAGVDLSGVTLVERQFTFTCDPGRTVNYQARLFDQDLRGRAGDGNPDEDLVSTSNGGVNVFLNAPVRSSYTVTQTTPVPLPMPDETDQTGEFYQVISFRVKSNGVQGGWSTDEFSAVRSIQL